MAVAMRQVVALLALCALAAHVAAHAYEEDYYDDVSVEDLEVYGSGSQARALSEDGAEPEPEAVLKPKSKNHHPRRSHHGKHHPPPHEHGKRKHHRSSHKKHHRGRVLADNDNGGGVIIVQEVRDQWPGPNGKTFKRWEVIIVNTGHRAVTVKEIKCENFHPSQKWNISPDGNRCKIPDWGQKLENNKMFNFGYIGDTQADFSVISGGDDWSHDQY